MNYVKDFTGVRRLPLVAVKPYTARAVEARGERIIGRAHKQSVAEAIARGHRIDNRGSRTRVNEHHPVGVAYIAV